jgi:hypothetical protein
MPVIDNVETRTLGLDPGDMTGPVRALSGSSTVRFDPPNDVSDLQSVLLPVQVANRVSRSRQYRSGLADEMPPVFVTLWADKLNDMRKLPQRSVLPRQLQRRFEGVGHCLRALGIVGPRPLDGSPRTECPCALPDQPS